MYTVINFKTKKAVKEALIAGQEIEVYQPGPFGNGPVRDGAVYFEGPHYPAAHTRYAKGVVQNGLLVKVQ